MRPDLYVLTLRDLTDAAEDLRGMLRHVGAPDPGDVRLDDGLRMEWFSRDTGRTVVVGIDTETRTPHMYHLDRGEYCFEGEPDPVTSDALRAAFARLRSEE